MLSLSTAFNIGRHRSWPKLLQETRRLGFSSVELNVEVPESWMNDIARSVEKGEIRISSLHNYCPRLEHLPENRTIYSGYLLTSDDADERRKAVEFTKRTLEWAGRLKAGAMVLHAGDVATEPSNHEFTRYIQMFGRKGRFYRQYEEAILKDRGRKSAYYLSLLMKGLDELLPYAAEHGVLIGLENRYHIHEIPNIEETGNLLDAYKGSPLGYWHDTGHAEVFARLGWVKHHEDYLRSLGERLIGMHIHDVKSLSDHLAPGKGDLDFGLLKPYIKPSTLLVIETHPKSSPAELVAGLDYLKKIGIA